MWDTYWAAAQKAGVCKEDIGRQLEAESVNWSLHITTTNFTPLADTVSFLPPPPSQAQIYARKAKFMEESLKLKREMLKMPGGRQYIPVDQNSEPVWDEEKNGEFALVVVKIDKERGLQEFGPV